VQLEGLGKLKKKKNSMTSSGLEPVRRMDRKEVLLISCMIAMKRCKNVAITFVMSICLSCHQSDIPEYYEIVSTDSNFV
jgi:hypothetical protein